MSEDAPKATIWVVDDVPSNRKLLKRMLEPAGYSCRLFSRAEALLEALTDSAPDLILMDVMMPGITGLDALQSMQRLGIGRAIPVILVTSMDDPSTKERAFSWGAAEFISKPVRRNELLMRVDRQLRARAQVAATSAALVWCYSNRSSTIAHLDGLITHVGLEPPEGAVSVVVMDVDDHEATPAIEMIRLSGIRAPICVLTDGDLPHQKAVYRTGATSVYSRGTDPELLALHALALSATTTPSDRLNSSLDISLPEGFLGDLRRELVRAQRYQHLTSLLVVALEPTDVLTPALIRTVIKRVQSVLRAVDTVDFDGKSQLRVLLPETSPTGAVAVSARVQTQLHALRSAGAPFESKIGIASTRGAKLDPARLLAEAVRALD